jgi:hypothetical protein
LPQEGDIHHTGDEILVKIDDKLEPTLNEVLRRNAGEQEFQQAVLSMDKGSFVP